MCLEKNTKNTKKKKLMESEVDNLYDQEYDESGLLTWEVEEEESKGKEKASEGDSLEGSSEGIQIEEGEGKRGKEKEEEEHISHLNQGGGGLPTHLCSICYDNVTQAQFIWMSGCGHGFCRFLINLFIYFSFLSFFSPYPFL